MQVVNPLELPSLPLDRRKAFPAKVPVIYFALSEAGEVLYIGQTVNLPIRWKAHHRFEKLKEIGNVKIAWMEVSDCSLLSSIEEALIKYFDPPLNVNKVVADRANYSKWGAKEEPINFLAQDLEVRPLTRKERFLEFSYRDLKERTGIGIGHWSNWFNGKATPTFATMEQAASDLGMPVLEFVEAFLERRSRTMQRHPSTPHAESSHS